MNRGPTLEKVVSYGSISGQKGWSFYKAYLWQIRNVQYSKLTSVVPILELEHRTNTEYVLRKKKMSKTVLGFVEVNEISKLSSQQFSYAYIVVYIWESFPYKQKENHLLDEVWG